MTAQIVQAEPGWTLVGPVRSQSGRSVAALYEVPIVAWRIRAGSDLEPVTVVGHDEKSWAYLDPKGVYRFPGLNWTTTKPKEVQEHFEKCLGLLWGEVA